MAAAAAGGVEGAGGECHAAQVVGADGEMDAAATERFAAAAGLQGRGLSYAVVSILGPQGSGKSTLLNHVFGTSFREMDALKGRHQTTKGIWIAKAVGIEPFTVVLDLEGTDGRERGQDDTAFEKQSVLFALTVSDIVMINLWCHDIGREHAANRPLLRTVFQVLMRLFSPRKTTLLLVIRDKTKTPLEYLTQALKEDIEKIWESVQKPEAYKEAALSDFFNVEVTALSSYEEKEELFKEQVGQLRQRFYHSIAPGGLAADRRGVVPSSGFCLSALQIWKVIRENKDLNLPAHKVMVATVRCEEIANEKLKYFLSDEGWLELDAAVKSGLPPSFGMRLNAILDSYLSEYDMETMYFDEGVRAAKRQQLESSMLDHTYPAIERVMEHLHLVTLNKFKSDLEQSLRNTEGFAESVRQCSQASMEEFDAGNSAGPREVPEVRPPRAHGMRGPKPIYTRTSSLSIYCVREHCKPSHEEAEGVMHGSHGLTQIVDTHIDGAATGRGLRIATHGGTQRPTNQALRLGNQARCRLMRRCNRLHCSSTISRPSSDEA